MTTVIRVGNLEEFTAEIPVPPPGTMTNSLTHSPVVRLSLTEQLINRANGSLPSKVVALHLQGINDRGEIIWLMEEHRLGWTYNGPLTTMEGSIYQSMKTLREAVEAHLRIQGYDVRAGSFGLPNSVQPLNGHFECVTWRKIGDDHYAVVVPDLVKEKAL
jgi:hypothetical protein